MELIYCAEMRQNNFSELAFRRTTDLWYTDGLNAHQQCYIRNHLVDVAGSNFQDCRTVASVLNCVSVNTFCLSNVAEV